MEKDLEVLMSFHVYMLSLSRVDLALLLSYHVVDLPALKHWISNLEQEVSHEQD